LICSFLDRITEKEWDHCVSEGILSGKQAEEAREELRAAVAGLLLFYLHRSRPESYKEFTDLSSRVLDRVLRRAD
ncbi:hypothetical protein JW906_01690, partial [bacterium]|nr:hypothetical protein [bacterium]